VRILPIIFTIFLPLLLSAQSKPGKSSNTLSGTYTYNGNAVKKDGEIYGYYGEIRVKEISKGKIAMAFLICKGAPSYNSGSFVDTLWVRGREAVYKTECDSNCTLIFKFGQKGITVVHKDSDGDYNSSCCFGHAVVAHGFYRKTSSKIPIIKDLQ
jgi:hypothetical protein